MKYFIPLTFSALALGCAFVLQLPSKEHAPEIDEASPTGRMAYEIARLADPATGELPVNFRGKELQFLAHMSASASRSGTSYQFQRVGPRNVGGRTRAFAIDASNHQVFFAGGVSGGLWRSDNEGQGWQRVTPPDFHPGVSCIAQDKRGGKTNIWYYGSGEVVGNSASKSYSAFYRGSGIYKSTDGGLNWSFLESTAVKPNKESDWDAVFRIAPYVTRHDSDVVLAATQKGIMRSNNGGLSWKQVHGGNAAEFTDLAVTSTGVVYAAISSTGGSTWKGIWRSTDGVNYVNITPNGFPATHDRTVMSIYSANENVVYFLSTTSGAGTSGNSLWRYQYLSGDGSATGGFWENRSSGLPDEGLNLYDGYCQVLGVKPDDEDVLFVGGTNLYRSHNGFADTNATTHVGGYGLAWDTNFTYRSGLHYPDQQSLTFHPADADRLISTTDGGIHTTYNCADPSFDWSSLSTDYVVSQFYGIAIDHATVGSEVIIGGLQDRGTFWTDEASLDAFWVSAQGADGAYCAVEDGGGHYYMSTQYANIRRAQIDNNGEVSGAVKVMHPDWADGSSSGLLFVHPFTLDPLDQNTMYLPFNNVVWRNDNLPATENEDYSDWTEIATVTGTITAISASESARGVVYVGTSQARIYRIDSAHTSQPVLTLISEGITNGGYTSCIAIDPTDADKLLVVYSNYNTVSLWYSENAGINWQSVEGNLTGETDAGVPASLYYIGNGPSARWAEIVYINENPTVFLGTSVGLFSTEFLDGEQTEWMQQGSTTIGNVVVDMLDYRAADRWLVVGTHGNGIYTATLDEPVGQMEVSLAKAAVFPNPTSDMFQLQWNKPLDAATSVTVYNGSGQLMVQRTVHKGRSYLQVDASCWPAGHYVVLARSSQQAEAFTVVVR